MWWSASFGSVPRFRLGVDYNMISRFKWSRTVPWTLTVISCSAPWDFLSPKSPDPCAPPSLQACAPIGNPVATGVVALTGSEHSRVPEHYCAVSYSVQIHCSAHSCCSLRAPHACAGGVTTPARYETAILKTVFTSASPPRTGTLSAPQSFFCENTFFCFVFVPPVVCQLSASCFAKTMGRPRVLVQKDQAKQKKFLEYEILKSNFLEK